MSMKPGTYVNSPNNIYPEIRENGGTVIYPGSRDMLRLPPQMIVADMDDHIAVYVQPYSDCDLKVVPVMRFADTDGFLGYVQKYGHREI